MDTVLLFALPLVGGLIFCSNFNPTRYRVAREDGHRLYFRAVLFGALIFAVVLALRSALLKYWPWYAGIESGLRIAIEPLAKDPASASATAALAMTCFYAMLLGWPSAQILNLVWKRERWLKEAVDRDEMESLLYRALEDQVAIAVSMKDRKVYVGFVVSTFDPTATRRTFSILPLMSGYRDAENLEIEFTTFYTDIYGEVALERATPLAAPLEHLSTEDFITALPLDAVASARIFDLVAYDEFNKPAEVEASVGEAPAMGRRAFGESPASVGGNPGDATTKPQ